MIFAAILAGGSGVRMGNPDKPKQFLQLDNRPILVHAVEKFCAYGGFDKVVVLAPAPWMNQTRDILRRYLPQFESLLEVVQGGKTRNDTIMNAIAYLEENYQVDGDAVLVTHDAVRPFVSYRIIDDNITAACQCGACDTVVPATDTIVESSDGISVSSIPDRSKLYQGQTPQSFNMRKLKDLFQTLSEDEKTVLTDACKIFSLKGEKVALVRGDQSNIKITYPFDMRVAKAMLEG